MLMCLTDSILPWNGVSEKNFNTSIVKDAVFDEIIERLERL